LAVGGAAWIEPVTDLASPDALEMALDPASTRAALNNIRNNAAKRLEMEKEGLEISLCFIS
jgi:hypothetical protein